MNINELATDLERDAIAYDEQARKLEWQVRELRQRAARARKAAEYARKSERQR